MAESQTPSYAGAVYHNVTPHVEHAAIWDSKQCKNSTKKKKDSNLAPHLRQQQRVTES